MSKPGKQTTAITTQDILLAYDNVQGSLLNGTLHG